MASVGGQNKTRKLIEIDGEHKRIRIAVVGDAGYIVGGDGKKIHRWKVNDGKEVGQPMDAGSDVSSIAASQDGKWIVGGMESGQVVVWDANSHEKVSEFKGHNKPVYAVDISPDATRIASGSDDPNICVWSRSTGEQLLGPLEHDFDVVAVKFSPDGQFIATAPWKRKSVQIYDSRDGHLILDRPIEVGSPYNQSLAWVSDSKQLFALSRDGRVHCLDVTNGRILSVWTVHGSGSPSCITLGSNAAFIAVSANSSVSFWDTTTHRQIGPLIRHPADIWNMEISANDDLVLSEGTKIVLRQLPDILPSSYFDDVGVFRSQRDIIHHDPLTAIDARSLPHVR